MSVRSSAAYLLFMIDLLISVYYQGTGLARYQWIGTIEN
jgi:hypothetical protein